MEPMLPAKPLVKIWDERLSCHARPRSKQPNLPTLAPARIVAAALLLQAIAVGFGSGCRNIERRSMALSVEDRSIDTAQESLVLLTLRVSNKVRPTFQPNVDAIIVDAAGPLSDDPNSERGEDKGPRTSANELDHAKPGTRYDFHVDEPFQKERERYNEYLVSMALPPGRYSIRFVFATSVSLVAYGHCCIPIYSEFALEPNTVVYLGRIEATNRRRKDASELRAGVMIPLVDQLITGYSVGTFDVRIYDNYDADLAHFRDVYPVLRGVDVEKSVLPPWEKPSDDELKADGMIL